MKCNCLADIKERLVEHAAKQGVVNPRVSENFLGINLETGDSVICLGYAVHGDNKPYNTQKGKPLSMTASFCPFCGESAKA